MTGLEQQILERVKQSQERGESKEQVMADFGYDVDQAIIEIYGEGDLP